ncbi:uncharacterized protein LOC121605544 isoform X2 [Chelmon rostratus]|uniref:uncharacterized protein LOC121605544 isoform X2 n=1 Tax=Chelmon rostratus TaxID=109905 RepID=UPI001BE81942|nr:uncharacterized protein LOC121605544 isoform X2 [Chelmon rostratus]
MRFSLCLAPCARAVPGRLAVTGIVGTNISLQFTFNVSLTKSSYFGVYVTDQKKIAEYILGKYTDVFDIYPENSSVVWHIKNLKLNDSGSYWATIIESGLAQESNKVQLMVQEGNKSSTVPPMPNNIPVTNYNGISSHIVTVLVVSPLVLLTALLPCLIWCLVRSKDRQHQPPPQQSSNPTVKETVEASENVPATSLVYSVLDFPKRPLEVLEMNPSDTDNAESSQPVCSLQ